MEKEILEILKSIQLDIKGLKDEVKDLKEGQKIIEKKLDGVVEQTAELLEFRTTVKTKLDELKGQVEKYEREYDFNKVAEIQYGEIPELHIDLDYTVRPFEEVEEEYLSLFEKYSGTFCIWDWKWKSIWNAFECIEKKTSL